MILHQNMAHDALKQSEKDFPCISVRNGIADGVKISAYERVGSMWLLLCHSHTAAGYTILKPGFVQHKLR